MVRFLVHVEGGIVRPVVGHVFTVGQVEGDMEVYDFLDCFNCNFKAMVAEDVTLRKDAIMSSF